MKKEIKEEFNKLIENEQKLPFLAIVFTIIALFVYCYFGSFSFFEQTFPKMENIAFYKIIYHNLMSFILFFCIGMLFSKFAMKKSFREMGLGLGDKKLGLSICLIAVIVVPIILLSVLLDDGMKATYPLIDFNVYGEWWQIILYFGSYLLYYLGWEYLFRGILLFGTKDRFGILGAILVTTLISALIHTSIGAFGKPMVETLSAIFAGVIFAFITYRTNSIYYSLFIHFLVGVVTDIYLFFLV